MPGTIDALDLEYVSKSTSGNPTVGGLTQNDNIGLGTAFAGTTVNGGLGNSNATTTFTTGATGGTTVAQIATPGIADNFYSTLATETINGTVYTIAIVDPPESQGRPATAVTLANRGDWSPSP